jgi:hypothetical protein
MRNLKTKTIDYMKMKNCSRWNWTKMNWTMKIMILMTMNWTKIQMKNWTKMKEID